MSKVFSIKVDDIGTAFCLDYEGRQYLVTAKHLVNSLKSAASGNESKIQLFKKGIWVEYPVNLVGHCDGEIDISVLSLSTIIAPSLKLIYSMDKIMLGQDVYLLGFPYKIRAESFNLNNQFPFPFVKKGCVSMIFEESDATKRLYIDAINNPGFSGGPIFCYESDNIKKPKVAGVISKFKTEQEPVFDKYGNKTTEYIDVNTGIMIAYSIDYAVELIKSNPIGCEI